MRLRFDHISLLPLLLALPILGLFVGDMNAATVTWVGDSFSNHWDTASPNWTGASSYYMDGDDVTFADSGSNSPDIALESAFGLIPGSVTVDNSDSHPYVFAGSSFLSGSTGITKNGSGTLTINNANTFTGDVNINGGTLLLGDLNALGDTSGGTFVNSGGTLDLLGKYVPPAETITVAAGGTVINTFNAMAQIDMLVLTGDATFGGSERLEIRGAPSFGTHTLTVDHSGNGAPGNYDAVRITNLPSHDLVDAHVVQGTLAFHNSGLGDAAGTITVTDNPLAAYVTTVQLMDSNAADSYENSVTKNFDFAGGRLYNYRGRFHINEAGGTVTLNQMATDIYCNSYHTTYLTQLWIDGLVTGDGGITKTGNGLLGLTAANDYTGATIVTDGTLRVDGSITSDTTVNSGAHLDGAGSIVGNVVMEAGSYLEPGTSVGTLAVDGDVSLAGTLDIEYDSDTATIDLLEVSGLLDLTDGTFRFGDLGAGTLAGGKYVFATYGTLTGEAAHVGLPEGWSVVYDYAAGTSIALVVPGLQVDIPGDADRNGKVDEVDAQVLAGHWGVATGAGWEDGDFDGDGAVGPKDASILAAHWGHIAGEATAVPEPSGLLALLALVGAWCFRRR